MAGAGGTSVGLITLDLIIKENLQKQLENIQSKLRGGFEQPIEQVKERFKSSFSAAESSAAKSSENIKKALGRISGTDSFSTQTKKAELFDEKISILKDKIERMEGELKACEKAFEGNDDISSIESLTKQYERLSANINNAKLQILSLQQKQEKLVGADPLAA